uniref:PR domain containing 2, with ZNF domain a n=1 Tax=Takifugu rubripes TaxID=31033 RepID=A0A3B5K4D2_TAKRU
MEDSPLLYISDVKENEKMEEEEEDIPQEETDVSSDVNIAHKSDLHQHPGQDIGKDGISFSCQHCERHFCSIQALERHMDIHMTHAYETNNKIISLVSNLDQLQHEKTELDSEGLDMLPHSSLLIRSNTPTSSTGDSIEQPDKRRVSDGQHACSYCEKVFSTHTSRQRHEHRVHEQNSQVAAVKPQLHPEKHLEKVTCDSSLSNQDKTEPGDRTEPAAGQDNEDSAERYMLDVSSNASENLSFYIDGKIVSTSTVASCESTEGHSVSPTLLRLDSLILDPSKELPGQTLTKRRTATPPLLPQIKTELESEVVVSSSSSSIVTSLIETILPQRAESTVAHKERTVFLSPKLKQLLEKEDGLKPTLALIADGQNSCTPVSLSVLPAGTGRFKRRTGSPLSSPTNPTTNKEAEVADCELVSADQVEVQCSSSPVHQPAGEPDDTSLSEAQRNDVQADSWPLVTGGNPCNQQPLDLSNTIKKTGDDAVLDLSLQKKILGEGEGTSNLASLAALNEEASKVCTSQSTLMDIREDNPIVTDFTIVTAPDLIAPVDPVVEGLVYGLTLPSNSLTPSPASLTPVALQPASPCTIAFAAPASHAILPTAPSLLTVLAPPPLTNPSGHSVQVLAPNISPEGLVICTENPLNAAESLEPPRSVAPAVSTLQEHASDPAAPTPVSDNAAAAESEPVVDPQPPTLIKEEVADCDIPSPKTTSFPSPATAEEDASPGSTGADAQVQTFTKNFICNVCEKLYHSMKELSDHVGAHADDWPYKCEFCVLLFGKPSDLLDHRSSLHGVGKTYACSVCTKEFVYLCNLKRHQEELHPGQQCTYAEEEKGKLRPQNYNNSARVGAEPPAPDARGETKKAAKTEEGGEAVAAEEFFTTVKIKASDGDELKGSDVRLGINQHYPSFKPPPFPYHNRSPASSVTSATNFTTHNIPQTFSTAIRCTKCGKSFDNMPELHKHILACATASDKKRYTPKKNPIPLRHFAKTQHGVLSATNSAHGLNDSNRSDHPTRSKPTQDSAVKLRLKVLGKRKKKLVQRVMPQRNKSDHNSNRTAPAQVHDKQEVFVCPHCSREFTMRRSRTKHMAVCPRKLSEVKKRKEGGISVTKENDEKLRIVGEDKLQASPQHKTRLQTAGLGKRAAILPVQTVFTSKRSKIIIKESMQPKAEAPSLNELPMVRTFNPAMRQYSRVQPNVKGIPIKITIVKPQQSAPTESDLIEQKSEQQKKCLIWVKIQESQCAQGKRQNVESV